MSKKILLSEKKKKKQGIELHVLAHYYVFKREKIIHTYIRVISTIQMKKYSRKY